MLDILIKLANAVKDIGCVTEASLFPSGYITICGCTNGGKEYVLTFRFTDEQDQANGNP